MSRIKKNIVLPICTGLNILIASIMVFTAFSGCIDPGKMPFAGLAGMTFAGWWILNLIMLIIDLFICRKLSPLPVIAILICAKPFWAFCPLNFSTEKITPEDSTRVFKVMSYNVLSFCEKNPEMQNDGFNRTMHNILSSDADIVVLAEYDNQGPISSHVPQNQIDSLNEKFPYHIAAEHGNAIYSKTPIMYIQLPSQKFASGSHEVYRTVIDGHGLMIFGVHMVSFGLNDTDKDLYREITDMQTDSVDISSVRSQLINKLYDAFKQRSVQALFIREYVEQLPSENIIICGDFNDVPDCRAIRILEKAGMKDAYSEVGFGPMITYNDSRFFFRIDHMLYRGAFKPISVERGNVDSSDHYPLVSTFIWDK